MKHLNDTLRAATGIAILLIAVPGSVWSHGSYHAREKRATNKIEAEPQNATAYLERATMHSQNGNWEAAENDLNKAAQLDPQLPELDLVRGYALAAVDRHSQALPHLSAFLTMKPKHVPALVARAETMMVLERPLAAARDYDRIITLSPRAGPDLFVKRSRAYVATKNYDQALHGLQEGIGRVGSIASLQLAVIDIHLIRDNYDGALDALNALLTVSPRQATWMARKGDVLRAAGRFQKAHEAYLLALESLRGLPQRNRSIPANKSLEQSLLKKLAASHPD